MSELALLTITAISIAFVHTVIGPDHYVPFVAMSRARGWSSAKMLLVTVGCGIGHVGGSVVVGTLGLALGFMVVQLERVESARGDVAAWLLIAFGTAYCVWGLWRALRAKPHSHVHVHADGTVHSHEHGHAGEHLHVHDQRGTDADGSNAIRGVVPWALFIVFVLGPCEPLIPLLILPGARMSILATVMIVTAYAVTTIVTMAMCVWMVNSTAARIPRMTARLEKFTQAFAGGAVLTCGLLIKLGW